MNRKKKALSDKYKLYSRCQTRSGGMTINDVIKLYCRRLSIFGFTIVKPCRVAVVKKDVENKL